MFIDANIPQDADRPEALASWNTSYVSPEGFVCRITLRAENGQDLLQKATAAIAFLLEHGNLPEQRNERRPSQEHDGKPERRYCFMHLCEMKRFEKDGRTWFSHRLPDGTWCRGNDQ